MQEDERGKIPHQHVIRSEKSQECKFSYKNAVCTIDLDFVCLL